MDFSHYFSKFSYKTEKLIDYGFVEKTTHNWIFEKNLTDSNLFVRVTISKNKFKAEVFDKEFNDLFLPFSVKNSQCKQQGEVEKIVEDILSNCFESCNVREEVVGFIENTYDILHETPWEGYPLYYVFKRPNNKKWFAIIMNIKRKQLGLDGEDKIDIINVKVDPKMVNQYVDNIHYFLAYHMNKKNWITILIDNQTDLNELQKLINNSYELIK